MPPGLICCGVAEFDARQRAQMRHREIVEVDVVAADLHLDRRCSSVAGFATRLLGRQLRHRRRRQVERRIARQRPGGERLANNWSIRCAPCAIIAGMPSLFGAVSVKPPTI